MQNSIRNIEQYIASLPEDRKDAIQKIRKTIAENIPEGFEEAMSFGMPSFVVPLSIYPDGYHTKPDEPLPFISYASQKKNISFYHMGMYADPELMDWYLDEYPHYFSVKPNVGKSCIRFKKPEQIPYQLIAELVSKMTVEEWIDLYEKNYRK